MDSKFYNTFNLFRLGLFSNWLILITLALLVEKSPFIVIISIRICNNLIIFLATCKHKEDKKDNTIVDISKS